jgi:hypothetical protein
MIYLRSLFLNVLFFATKPLLFAEQANVADHTTGSVHQTISIAILRTQILPTVHLKYPASYHK